MDLKLGHEPFGRIWLLLLLLLPSVTSTFSSFLLKLPQHYWISSGRRGTSCVVLSFPQSLAHAVAHSSKGMSPGREQSRESTTAGIYSAGPEL